MILPFTKEFSASAADFVVKVLVDRLRAKAVVVGPTLRFGHKAGVGTSSSSSSRARSTTSVSSRGRRPYVTGDAGAANPFPTLTCRLVAEGDVAGAAEILGRPHRVEESSSGAPSAAVMGFHGNVEISLLFAIPADGVYAGWLHAQGEAMPAAISVGTNLQFEGTERTAEAAIDRVGLDLYGLHVVVDSAFARGQAKFETLEALLVQMGDDVDKRRDHRGGRHPATGRPRRHRRRVYRRRHPAVVLLPCPDGSFLLRAARPAGRRSPGRPVGSASPDGQAARVSPAVPRPCSLPRPPTACQAQW